MNILLISANREMNPYPVFPIGLAYLAGPLARAGHRLRVLDLCFADDAETAVKQVLKEFVPDAVVVSIRNIDNVTFPASRSYLDEIRSVVGLCRREASVILGGSGFSIMPVELLEKLGGDYGVVGEGEEVLVELVSALSRGESHHSLPGVLTRGNPDYGAARAIERIGRHRPRSQQIRFGAKGRVTHGSRSLQ